MSSQRQSLASYTHLRQIGRKLTDRIVESLEKSDLLEGANTLGIVKDNTFVFNNEMEPSILMDFCLFNVRRGGQNAVQRFQAAQPKLSDEEKQFLKGMTQARYRWLAFERAELGVGVHAFDLLHNEPIFVHDIGFSQSGRRGLVMGTQVYEVDGIAMTSGAPLPVAVQADQAKAMLNQYCRHEGLVDASNLSPEQSSRLATLVARVAMESGMTDRIGYLNDDDPSTPEPRRPRAASSRHVGRNDPCPCRSGKKYKMCCGR